MLNQLHIHQMSIFQRDKKKIYNRKFNTFIHKIISNQIIKIFTDLAALTK